MPQAKHYLPDSGFWKNKRVLVTGATGFLGRQIVERLNHFGAKVSSFRKSEYNLISFDQAMKCMSMGQPEIVFHCAAYYGGLGITMTEPGKIYYENLVMGANTMEAARQHKVQKFISLGSACSYPGHLLGTLKEDELWSGPLHDTVVSYGSVKRMMAIQGLAYRKQYGFKAVHLILTNLYGPFDAYDDYRSHAAGALIKKFVDAHRAGGDVSVWGTGKAIREFLYCEDAANGVVLAGEKYDDVTPLNLGTGKPTAIRELVETIANALNFKGKINWDSTKPDGQPAKVLDAAKMESKLGWKPQVSLAEGIKKTIAWYQEFYPAKNELKKAA